MNLSRLMTRIKMKLGIYAIAIPIDNLDDFMLKIIQDITVPVFSIYEPYYKELDMDTTKMEKLEDGPNYQIFLLPEYEGEKLLFVEDVQYAQTDVNGIGYIGGYMPTYYYDMNMLHGLIMSNAEAQVISKSYPAITFRYEHPRKLLLFNNISSTFIHVRLAFEHDKNLSTIPETASESFFKLALLDIQENLYSTMKHYNEIETSYGRVNLHIDDWQQAEADRKSLLEEWDNTYHMDLPTQMIWR